MPLLTCPDCEGKVSDVAPACPHCGRPAEKELPKDGEKRSEKSDQSMWTDGELIPGVRPKKKWLNIVVPFALLVFAAGNAEGVEILILLCLSLLFVYLVYRTTVLKQLAPAALLLIWAILFPPQGENFEKYYWSYDEHKIITEVYAIYYPMWIIEIGVVGFFLYLAYKKLKKKII